MTIDGKQIEALLRSMTPDASPIHIDRMDVLDGGRSAETFRVRGTSFSAEQRELDVVVRRVPADGLLAPYDIERECRILRALQGSPIPVPAVVGCDAAGEYLGAPCMATSYVDGEPLSFFGQTTTTDDVRLPDYFAALAAIHSLDWRACGLDFLDAGEDPVEAELRRDEARLHHHNRFGPDERRLAGWLRANKPAKTYKTLLHGDANPANYLFEGTRIAAVLDWELALIGDPRLDLGFFAAIQSTLGGAWALDAAAHVRGYETARPDADLRRLDYFEAVGLFRLTGFLHAGDRLHGADVSALRDRLHGRFERIASGNADDPLTPAAGHQGEV